MHLNFSLLKILPHFPQYLLSLMISCSSNTIFHILKSHLVGMFEFFEESLSFKNKSKMIMQYFHPFFF